MKTKLFLLISIIIFIDIECFCNNPIEKWLTYKIPGKDYSISYVKCHNNKIYCCTTIGLIIYDYPEMTYTIHPFEGYSAFNNVDVDMNNNIWLANNDVVIKYNLQNIDTMMYDTLGAYYILKVRVDFNNNIWVTTLNEGILKLDGDKWISYYRNGELPEHTIWDIVLAPDSTEWVGTIYDMEGISYYDGVKWNTFYENKRSYKMFDFDTNKVMYEFYWSGASAIVKKYDPLTLITFPSSVKFTLTPPIFITSKNRILLGTLNGLYELFKGEISTNAGFPRKQVKHIEEDKYGNIWVVIDSSIVRNKFIYEQKNDVTICYGESYFAEGKNQSIPGTYYDKLISSTGIDSIIITQLSVNERISTSLDIIICDGEQYFVQGANQFETGIYYDTLSAVNGCDSVIITELTINNCFSPVTNYSGNENNIKIYPIPVESILNIKFDNLSYFKLYDFFGRNILNDNKDYIDFSKYKEGLYYIVIFDKLGSSKTIRFSYIK
jgi:hypothetical protein